MNISHDYTETGPFISDGDVDKKVSHILNMMKKNKSENNDKNVVVPFNSNAALYNNYYRGDTLCGLPSKQMKKNFSIIINNVYEIYSRPDKVRGFTLSGNNANPELNEKHNLITTGEPTMPVSDKKTDNIFPGDIIKSNNIFPVQREIMENNASLVQPAEMINITSDEEIYDYGKINIILTETSTEVIPAESPVPSELPVFLHHTTESSETKHSLPNSVLNQRGNGEQGKMLFLSTDTGKCLSSQENNRADYYFSYYFRQKYQPSEQVYIYRDPSNRFKLDTYSELVKRKLKSAMDVNAVDNIDIL